MKKIVICLVIVMICCLNIKKKVVGKETKPINSLETVIYEDEKSVDSVIGIDNQVFLYELNGDCYLQTSANEYFLGIGKIQSYLHVDQIIYILTIVEDNTVLYTFNLQKNIITQHLFESFIGQKIINVGNSFYLIGLKKDNGLIYVLDYQLNVINERSVGGSAKESFIDILYSNQCFYLVMYKDALSNNSEINSSGNVGELKSVIIKTDLEFNIQEVLYLDESSNNEKVTTFFILNDKIHLLLNADNHFYYYQLNQNLKIINHVKVSDEFDYYYLLPNYKSNLEFLLLATIQDNIVLYSFQNNSFQVVYEFQNRGSLYAYNCYLGELYLYLNTQNDIRIVKFSEYEIIKNEPLYVNKLNYREDRMDHIIVESFFEELNFFQKNIEPYFQKTICGTYDIVYEAIRENEESILVESTIVVEEYTNFVNEGIYPQGKVLEFFGYATLDGKVIYNGTSVDTCGEHLITITDANRNQKEYHIYIVEDYYLNRNTCNIPYEFKATNQSMEIKINLDCELDIESIIINDKKFTNYTYQHQELKLFFDLNQTTSSYLIEKINYWENGELRTLDIYELIDVVKIKKNLNINVNKTLSKEVVKLNLEIEDLDQTFMYFKIKTNDKKIIVTTNSQLELSNHLLIYLVYENGIDIQEQLICEYDVDEVIALDFKFTYEKNSLTSTTISYSIPNNFEQINRLVVCGTELTNYYHTYTNESFLSNVIIIGLGIVLIFGLFIGAKYFVQKRKKRKNYKI